MTIAAHRGDRVLLYSYVESEISMVFPSLPIRQLPQLIEENRADGRLAIRRAVRQWVREKGQ